MPDSDKAAKATHRAAPEEVTNADNATPEAEPADIAYTDPADAEAAAKRAKGEPLLTAKGKRGADALRGEDWAGRPRFVCPICDDSRVAAADTPEGLNAARDEMIDHIRATHPERAPSVIAEA